MFIILYEFIYKNSTLNKSKLLNNNICEYNIKNKSAYIHTLFLYTTNIQYL